MGRLEGKRIVVTGGANGIGRGCAIRFVAEGARVVIADIDEPGGTAVAAELGGPDRAIFQLCDVNRRAEISAAIDEASARWGGVDVMLNNAGIVLKGDILTLGEEAFDRVLAVNLKAAFHGTQLAARRMVEQGSGGVVINMSSVNAILNIADMLAYNISKGGLNQLTRNAAIALAPHGVRVVGIGPGTILTDLARKAVWNDPAVRQSILSRTPIGRPGEPDEVAAIAVFLASSDASYVTGETIYADGGRLGLNYTVAVTS